MLRSGANPGEVLCVTGSLGKGGAGLAACKAGLGVGRADPFVVDAYLTPIPRLREGRILCEASASACIDVSDGLAADAGHIAQRSGVDLRIDVDRIPVSAAVRSVGQTLDLDPLELATSGGDDFELLFTAPSNRVDEIRARVKDETGTEVSAIGEVRDGDGAVRFEKNGEALAIGTAGYDHFEEST